MATTSTNLSLRKPESADFVSVSLDIAGNMQTIDDKWASSAAANIGAAAAAGTALTVARTDHVHAVGSGTVSAPGLPIGESNSGFYRIGAANIGAAISGALAWAYSATGIALETALSWKHIATPAAPAAGYLKTYAKSDNYLYRQTPAAAEVMMLDTVSMATVFARTNRVINGDMRVQQRATLGSTDDTFTLDRWNLLLEAASAAAVAQETSDVPSNGSNRALKLTVGSGEDNKFGIVTFLEFLDSADLRGKTVSLQAKLKATAAITDVRMAVLEWTSTADSLTSDVVGTWGSAGTNPTLAANWAYLGAPANLSATTSWATYKVEGLTVGASANNIAVFIWCEDETTTITTDSLLITDVQLEEGAICTQFERRPYQQELAFCQRYFETMGSAIYDGLGMGSWTTTTNARIWLQYAVRKRANATISFSSAAHFDVSFDASSTVVSSSAGTAYNGPGGAAIDLTCPAFGTAGEAALLFTSNASGRVFASAEL